MMDFDHIRVGMCVLSRSTRQKVGACFTPMAAKADVDVVLGSASMRLPKMVKAACLLTLLLRVWITHICLGGTGRCD